MNVCVLNISGNVGKTTTAVHMLRPRIKNASIFSVENLNSGIEDFGIEEAETIKGKRFGDLSDNILLSEAAIVDVGASNVEDFLNLMKQYQGSHDDYDYFVIPTISQEKQLKDTITTIKILSGLGVPAEKIRVLFNNVELDDANELDGFNALFGYHSVSPTFTINADATVLSNEVFDGLKQANKTLDEIANDKTDYKAKVRAKGATAEDKEEALKMLALQRLATAASANLDDAFTALFA
ncbi:MULTISPECIES: StbB family protein [Methylophaga]|uniref:Plasmid stabilization protein n=1 Tax=Methylophaga thalassica TaxID=40223 RepID=A0ABQ5TYU2_9GAMM|nr:MULTISPECIES: StbB family protein [Methylophaga]AUZ86128.1 hypothetical protein CDW43_15870 [Methylophaga nitratireducenticrescens]GLQ00636.1 hypothetical protein GCM10007891_24890 [Methylophaga thalassica]